MGVCIVSFSSRENGNCEEIGKYIGSFYNDTIKSFEFSEFTIEPCGKCSYECFRNNSQCPYLNDKEYEIYDAITNSDLTYFIVPNYSDFPCANFFIFNERSQCYFQKHPNRQNDYENVPKKFIVISNTGRENFITAITYHVSEAVTPNVLFLSAKFYNKSSIDGNILTSFEAKDDIKNFVLNTKPLYKNKEVGYE